jgi:membrane protein DedA with SNARE-associated domain
LAGATGLRFHPFFVANAFGALVFVPYAVSLGYAVGYGMGEYVAQLRHVEQIILVGAVAGIVAFVGWRVWGICRVSSRR